MFAFNRFKMFIHHQQKWGKNLVKTRKLNQISLNTATLGVILQLLYACGLHHNNLVSNEIVEFVKIALEGT